MINVLVLLLGIVIGGMNAIAGGGMLLGFPILLALGVPALTADITSNIIVLPGQLSSAYGYKKFLRKIPKSYLLLLVPCAVGAVMGALILRHTSFNKFNSIIPWLILFAVALFIFQPYLHFHFRKHLHNKRSSLRPPLWLAVALLPLSIYGGYFGAGLGFIMLAFLGFTSLNDIHRMNALKNLVSATVAAMSILCLYSSHMINWHYGIIMGIGNLIGGYSGSRLAQKIPSHIVRFIVIGIGLVTVFYLLLHR